MIRIGKTEAEYEELYRTHYQRVLRALHAMTGTASVAEELTQDAFEKSWKSLPQFGFRSSMKTWVMSIAINLGRDWLRGHPERESHELPETGTDQSISPEVRAIRESLLQVDYETRTLLVLHYYEGMNQDEIARMLNVPEGTIKSRLHMAKRLMKGLLLEKGFDV